MRGTVVRDGQTIIDLRPEGYTFDANPPVYNYNAFAVMGGVAQAANATA